ncbi:hypothetical protein AYM40_06885 [Paraburkholderia phytofirmans OLGA172]|uniref:Uncharacterized protein n=1 Tax=Paraburkholderia phytofirmans OLGA172 TaxID=1417228 RepID=A0A167VW18_9BURK|nr:hypothetical protein [Paraburkholderia phytofirmans]ANB72127.1 hypothetical protein AYM40_06885 [Paraburkholderia phytofirmans OLGA172]
MRNVTEKKTAKPVTEPAKRSRGRPRKPDALTAAQRQAAYRQRKREASINVIVTENCDLGHQVQSSGAELDQTSAAAESHERQLSVR